MRIQEGHFWGYSFQTVITRILCEGDLPGVRKPHGGLSTPGHERRFAVGHLQSRSGSGQARDGFLLRGVAGRLHKTIPARVPRDPQAGQRPPSCLWRRSATGEGTFNSAPRRAEIIRELKGIVELWSARKAVLSIQQSSAKHDIFRNSPSKIPHSRGRSWNFTGRSAPCTPSLAFPHSWQQRYTSPGPSKKALSDLNHPVGIETGRSPKRDSMGNDMEEEPRVNYIVPCFEESSPEKVSANKSPHPTTKKTFLTFQVTADVGKDGCVRTKHTRIMGACSIPEVRTVRVEACSGESSDECCYVEVDPSDAKTPRAPTPSPILAPKSRTTSTSDPEGKAQRPTCVVL
ncbi:hypothetical protein CDAR_60511 [Caerostris darwini]|uniref:Uncharacterized protein n=1 Tax=Caerostris darwini TaxID=1538125 RepID=A0AAV4WCM3_9ARAC|nr:hypothetical protein CDAR_60511 [Caerostris darwini]